ncbi:MAG: hypothetical protein ACI9KN_002506 [Gammaproteobacteria bacterium]|jgi:uncharacterized protein YjiS (DUF1127 family)
MTTFSKNSTQDIAQNLDDAQHGLYRLLQQWVRIQRLKIEVANERKQLLTLSDARLRDLGTSRSEAVAESLRRDLPAARLNAIKNTLC